MAGEAAARAATHHAPVEPTPQRMAKEDETRSNRPNVMKLEKEGALAPPIASNAPYIVSAVCGKAVWQLSATGRIIPSRSQTLGPRRWYATASLLQSPAISASPAIAPTPRIVTTMMAGRIQDFCQVGNVCLSSRKKRKSGLIPNMAAMLMTTAIMIVLNVICPMRNRASERIPQPASKAPQNRSTG